MKRLIAGRKGMLALVLSLGVAALVLGACTSPDSATAETPPQSGEVGDMPPVGEGQPDQGAAGGGQGQGGPGNPGGPGGGQGQGGSGNPGGPGGGQGQGGSGNPGGPGGQDHGPASHQVFSASSADGLAWTHDEILIADHASVPAAIVTETGMIRVYYVDASDIPETVNCLDYDPATGASTVLGCEIANMPTEKALDPSIVRLEDGRYRLYFYGEEGPLNMDEDHTIYAAISEDGVHFTYEQAVFTASGIVDPDVWWNGEEWLMYVFSMAEHDTIVARSADGLTFDYVGPLGIGRWGTTAPFALEDGSFRLYAFNQEGSQEVASFISTDGGDTWVQEDGVRLTAPEGFELTDPFVVRLPDGSWRMVYKVSAERERGGPGGGQPGGPAPTATP